MFTAAAILTTLALIAILFSLMLSPSDVGEVLAFIAIVLFVLSIIITLINGVIYLNGGAA